jgi:hypothetical protein
LAQGVPEDGINLTEDLQAAHNLLENELCFPIQVYVGMTALTAIQRTFREVDRSNPTFAGIQLTASSKYGNDTVLLVGSPGASNDDEVAFEKLLGTFWRHKEQKGLICRIYGVEESSHGDRGVQISHWDDETQGLRLLEAQLLRDFDPSESPTKTVFENGSVLVSHPPEYVGDLANLPQTEVQIDAPSLLERIQLADSSDKDPQIGETWWNVTTGKPVQVFGVGRTQESLEFTRVTDEDGLSYRQLTGAFIRYHTPPSSTNSLEIWVDQEYQKSDGTIWTLKSVTLPVLSLEGSDGKIELVRVLDFRSQYTLFIRRSAVDRLMDPEDLV